MPAKDSISIAYLDELHAAIGSRLALILQSYVQTSREHINALIEALQQHDSAKMADICHTLKGSSANIGAIVLPQLCQQLQESAGGEASPQKFNTLAQILSMIKSENSAIIERLDAYLNSIQN
ncbi:Hpt domain-containing protein [Thiomicrorhabdus sp. zzn3]|uniref:Hpt domain-containing protein n=1 Tax=Thiomicrorhabdus sp. zzn3 TaxID=3039775 RepID=UPI0024367BFF|nr:Hpt domain-containing protein [Thiomicrorhabdus sp. zzn3]MDG6778920.1 Hpt domain-containing protein [Thiomicrorhabdus sp. zzn3]